MENIIEIYRRQLTIETERLLEISEKILPLQKEKERTEKNIQALKQLIGSNEEIKQEIPKGPMGNKTPMEAYKEVARDYFKSDSFKEQNIRDIATREGLEVNGKIISDSYSRQVITRLITDGTFEKVKKGVYRYKKQKEKNNEYQKTLYPIITDANN